MLLTDEPYSTSVVTLILHTGSYVLEHTGSYVLEFFKHCDATQSPDPITRENRILYKLTDTQPKRPGIRKSMLLTWILG